MHTIFIIIIYNTSLLMQCGLALPIYSVNDVVADKEKNYSLINPPKNATQKGNMSKRL